MAFEFFSLYCFYLFIFIPYTQTVTINYISNSPALTIKSNNYQLQKFYLTLKQVTIFI